MEYPEIENGQASPQRVRALCESHGVVLLRQFLSSDEAEALRRIAGIAFGIGDLIIAHADAERVPKDVSDGLRHGYMSWQRMNTWLACATPDMSYRLGEITSKVQAAAASAYGDPETQLLEGFSVIRRHRKVPRAGEVTTAQWHRDYSFVGPAGIEHSLNCWLPMVEVGENAPSIEIVVGSHQYMRGVPDDTPGITNIAEEWVDENLSTLARWIPNCKPGDVVMFDDQTVHRTQRFGGFMAVDRMNFEFRWKPSAAFVHKAA